ncbi:TonB-dependent receptor domain-containing protein [Flavihumibacter stibioxidans]|uniref:TonB-dependent receptor n=1 Tax=Flavihumibacter stibioxidans TaxID=1834163 RepID=A0ABR7M8D8_9BACT|nr:TonB-dependent receptor [Flavihumibacter stibioxidans]MBC6491298.1 TonB-dependent receptor [Flavihumibacter stibioxidans]
MRYFFALVFICFGGMARAQSGNAVLSGTVKNKTDKSAIAYANVVLKKSGDSSFVTGVVTDEKGQFTIQNISEGKYMLEISRIGFNTKSLPFLAGKLNKYFDLGIIELTPQNTALTEVTVTANPDAVTNRMDKKTFKLGDNISQAGGSLLQAMKNLPGVTTDESGKVLIRGSNRVTILIDGKQTALTGFGNQAALDNIPASAIERIEIINNPSSRYDANGNAGIINIIYKKSRQNGLNGKIGFSTGLGALWMKEKNLPGIRPQYAATPKVNPSLSLNYRKNKVNAFFQGDYLYNKTLNRNDFAERFYSDGDTVRQQVLRNRITTSGTVRTGIDWFINNNNTLTISGLYSREVIKDNGDIPYYNSNLTQQKRLWKFFEDEVITASTVAATYQHKFNQAGHVLNISLNYTFNREDEKYFLTNIMPSYTGRDTFMLIADQNVTDLTIDYTKPLKHGRFETGTKLRWRYIPTDMRFYPGINSPLDTNAAGWAKYQEVIPAVYGNYIYESKMFELEAGLRVEYVNLQYNVNPDHNTYKSDGYNYFQPFPSVRLGYNLDEHNKLSLYYNRRVDRPDEGDIRIFPKYDEPEILKVGNPALRPQFTQTIEAGYKSSWNTGYLYTAFFYKLSNHTITRIGTTAPGSDIIYSVFQNADKAWNTGMELIANQTLSPVFTINVNAMLYKNTIGAFSAENKYPVPVTYSAGRETAWSGNIKLNGLIKLPKNTDLQLTAIYLAPDIIPQGRIARRFSVDFGAKKAIQGNKGELFINATDIFNTLRIQKDIRGTNFRVISTDYYETQVFRLGYSYKFSQ